MENDAGVTPDAPEPLDFTSLVPLPEPVPASSERSPNRKPRFRRALKLWDVRQAMRLFLRVYLLTGDTKIASERVDRHPTTIKRWAEDDVAFKSAIDDIAAMWADILDRNLKNLDLKAIEVMEAALDQTDDMRLAVGVAMKVLKAHGYLTERATLAHSGPGAGSVPIKITEIEIVPPAGLRNPEGRV